jgi:hypothetical protein
MIADGDACECGLVAFPDLLLREFDFATNHQCAKGLIGEYVFLLLAVFGVTLPAVLASFASV